MKMKITFVYNSNSGIFNSVKDFVHKKVSPKSYKCNLGVLTHSGTRIDNKWKGFVGKFTDVEFLHKNEFFEKYGERDIKLPAVFIDKGNGLRVLIFAREISTCKNVDELIYIVQKEVNDQSS